MISELVIFQKNKQSFQIWYNAGNTYVPACRQTHTHKSRTLLTHYV